MSALKVDKGLSALSLFSGALVQLGKVADGGGWFRESPQALGLTVNP